MSWCIGVFIPWTCYSSPERKKILDGISIDQDKGPGDRGNDGIDDFKKQHHCNDICKSLNLPPFEQNHNSED